MLTQSIKSREIKEFPKRSHSFVSEKTYKGLMKGQQLITENKMDAAKEILEKLDASTSGKDKENPQVKIILGYIYASAGQYDKAISAYQSAYDAQTLSEAQSLAILGGLAQFYTNKKAYAKSNEILQEYMSYVKNPKYFIYVLYAQNWYFLEKYALGLEAIELGIEQAMATDKSQINETMYQLKFVLEFSLQKYKAAADTLMQLVDAYPEKKSYWGQLLGVLLQAGEFSTGLVIAQLIEKLGYLESESEKLNLANLYYMNGIPYLSGKLALTLTQNLKNLELAGSAFYTARELKMAIEAYIKATKYDDTGKNLSIIGQLYLDSSEYNKAIEYFSLALKKGKLKNLEIIYMNRAVCYHELHDNLKAKADFEKVLEINPNNKTANDWLNFFENAPQVQAQAQAQAGG